LRNFFSLVPGDPLAMVVAYTRDRIPGLRPTVTGRPHVSNLIGSWRSLGPTSLVAVKPRDRNSAPVPSMIRQGETKAVFKG